MVTFPLHDAPELTKHLQQEIELDEDHDKNVNKPGRFDSL